MAVGLLLATTSCSDHIVEELSDEEIDAIEDALSAEAGQYAFGLGDGHIETKKDEVTQKKIRQLATVWKQMAPEGTSPPHWQELKNRWSEDNDGDGDNEWSLRSLRTIFYVSSDHKKANRKFLNEWIESVKTEKLDPYITLSARPLDSKKPVSPGKFGEEFEKLLHEFSARTSDPKVLRWGIINEPDLELPVEDQNLEKWAKTAVKYFVESSKVLRKCKRERICSNEVMLVAGEFGRGNKAYWNHYAKAMQTAVHQEKGGPKRFPRIWSLHPYRDIIEGNIHITKEFVGFLEKWETEEDLPNHTLRAWITESGTLLHSKRGCTNINNDPRAQYRGANTVFKMNGGPSSKKLANRVDRIYWWGFQQSAWPPDNKDDKGEELEGHVWDSALVDYHGFKRPSYCALANPGKSYRDPSVQACMNLHPAPGELRVELAAAQCREDRDLTSVDPPPSPEDPPPSPEDPPSIPVYRWVNGIAGDHFYTNDPAGELAPATGYTYEGIVFSTFTCDTPGTSPFFRWWSDGAKDHFYTADPSDGPAFFGYVREGNIGCIASSQSGRSVPLHRWWDPVLTDHFYTVDPNGEIAPLLGYQYEQIAGYVLPPK
ncbi:MULTISPECIES: hypothetical protein [Sorangium]|nr:MULTISPECIES: hypothetical protein [Sorangium]